MDLLGVLRNYCGYYGLRTLLCAKLEVFSGKLNVENLYHNWSVLHTFRRIVHHSGYCWIILKISGMAKSISYWSIIVMDWILLYRNDIQNLWIHTRKPSTAARILLKTPFFNFFKISFEFKTDARSAILDELRIRHPLGHGSSSKYAKIFYSSVQTANAYKNYRNNNNTHHFPSHSFTSKSRKDNSNYET